jgi:hypothetical protein
MTVTFDWGGKKREGESAVADPNKPPFNLMDWLNGRKTYISLIVTAAKFWYVAARGKPGPDAWDTAIDATLALLVGSAFRSAWKGESAKVVSAIVSPEGPVAQKIAASIPPEKG